MKFRVAISVTACLVISMAIGCQTPSDVYRSQTPGEAYYAPASDSDTVTEEWVQQQPRGQFRGGHYHTFDYRVPRNLRYPPANQPPAVVQYPYYTLRSPTDFFMK